MGNDRLEQIRKDIDSYDKQIVELFELRMEKAVEALKYKQAKGLPIVQNDREKKVLEKVADYLRNKDFYPELEQLYLTIMKLSRQIQARKWNLSDFLLIGESLVLPLGERLDKKTVAFQGEKGSFGHRALKEYFGNGETVIKFEKFDDVFAAVTNGSADYGVLPIENSSTGGIHDVYDLLLKYDLYIVGEQTLQVDHHLLGVEGATAESIKEVFSHPQGFNQCRAYLNHNPDWRLIPFENTATSAKYIKEQNDIEKAAIASKEAAKIYNLKIIAENIHTNKENWTKFIIIGKKVEINKDSKKISLVYSLRHNVGSLYDSLGTFVKQGINLAKVESRPIPNQPWKYHFYVDIEGNLHDKQVQDAIKTIQGKSLFLKILGNY